MITPFNEIYKIAESRESEIRAEAARQYPNREQAHRQSPLAAIAGFFKKTYKEQYYRTSTPNECVQVTEYR